MSAPTQVSPRISLTTMALAGSAALLILAAFWPTFQGTLEHRELAREEFRAVMGALRETEEAQRLLESQADALQTEVDAVRLQARNEFRLILPGERLEVIQFGEAPSAEERLHTAWVP